MVVKLPASKRYFILGKAEPFYKIQVLIKICISRKKYTRE